MAKKRLVGNTIETVNKKTHKVKGPDGKEYKPSAKRAALFKDSDGDWLEAEQWPSVAVTLVCRIAECPANGEEVPAIVGENVDGVYRAGCGACGNAIGEIWVDEGYVPPPLDPTNVTGGVKP